MIGTFEPSCSFVRSGTHVSHPAEVQAPIEPAKLAPQFDIEKEEATAEKEELLTKEQVLEELQDVAEDFEESDEEPGEGGGNPQGFAPGSGVIEEETIEEEEYDYAPLYAHQDEHDLDEFEEETIDHNLTGTDLGEVVRDTHLDQRIHVAFNSNVATEDTEEEETDEDLGVESVGDDGFDEESEEQPSVEGAPAPSRRTDDGRRGGRGGRHGRGRSNNGGRGGDRGGDRGRRATSQLSDLPIISDLLKQGQEILVQIAKEPIAKKGARITRHIALPGRFLVFMPTVNHVGVSRKISSDDERQRLKQILISEKGDATGGFIVRTAADGASEEESASGPPLSDQLVGRHQAAFGVVQSAGADLSRPQSRRAHSARPGLRQLLGHLGRYRSEYERIVRFLHRFQPSLIRRVKLYTKETPLFEQFGIRRRSTRR